MIQVKTFKGTEFQQEELEDQLNNWIKENNIKVVDIKISLSPQSSSDRKRVGMRDLSSDLLYAVIYETE